MNRIRQQFQKGPVFAAYLTAGDGGEEYSFQAARALIKGGVDLLEIGLPFTDPIADGPTIQQAMQRALNQGATSQSALSLAQRIRIESDIPLVLFTYYNLILQAGPTFLSDAKQAGFDGLLVVDLPLEEGSELFKQLRTIDLSPILVATPATSTERMKRLAAVSDGFLYYACRKGTTGARNTTPADLSQQIARLRTVCSLPILIGFGIGDQKSARQALQHADAFVVGSKFVEALGNKASFEQITQLARAIDPRSCVTHHTSVENPKR